MANPPNVPSKYGFTSAAYDGQPVVIGTPLSTETRALFVGAAGDVTVTMASGTVLTFANVPAGATLPVRVVSVNNGTTASNMVALW